jgi:hypothetical protein
MLNFGIYMETSTPDKVEGEDMQHCCTDTDSNDAINSEAQYSQKQRQDNK